MRLWLQVCPLAIPGVCLPLQDHAPSSLCRWTLLRLAEVYVDRFVQFLPYHRVTRCRMQLLLIAVCLGVPSWCRGWQGPRILSNGTEHLARTHDIPEPGVPHSISAASRSSSCHTKRVGHHIGPEWRGCSCAECVKMLPGGGAAKVVQTATAKFPVPDVLHVFMPHVCPRRRACLRLCLKFGTPQKCLLPVSPHVSS